MLTESKAQTRSPYTVPVSEAGVRYSDGLEGIHIPSRGFTRLAAAFVYCLSTGETPVDVVKRGTFNAYIETWGWGMWLNDFFDRQNPLQAKAILPDLQIGLNRAHILKDGKKISLIAEKDRIIDALPGGEEDEKGVKAQVSFQINRFIEGVCLIEQHRPSVRFAKPLDIKTYREEVNKAIAIPLIAILAINSPDPQANIDKAEKVLVPFMHAMQIIDDIVGTTDDLAKGLSTYATWALRVTGDFKEAEQYLGEQKQVLEKGKGKQITAGLSLLKRFPKTAKLLNLTFTDFLNNVPLNIRNQLFKAGAKTLYQVYPWMLDKLVVRNFYALTHTGNFSDREEVIVD